MPAMAKATANYANSQLIKMEAITNGYHEGIALDHNGRISEGSGENLFLVWKGRLYTPPLSASTLPGITRLSVIQLSRELGADGFVIFNLTQKLATDFLPPMRLGVTSVPPLASR